mgnify:CR=1 FL=1
MNYFQLFGIEPTFFPDGAALRKKFLELSRAHHPDYFVHADADAQQDALQKISDINKAYKTLNNPEAVAAYVLELRGLLTQDEKYQLPPDFLMEMMDLNEAAESGAAPDAAIAEKEQELDAAVQPVLKAFNDKTTDNKELEPVKEWWYKKKYLHRLKAQSGGMS